MYVNIIHQQENHQEAGHQIENIMEKSIINVEENL